MVKDKSMSRLQRAKDVFGILRTVIPAPETELEYRDSWQLLVAVMLSAQCTDARVNLVTPALFKRFPDTASMAASTQEEVFKSIRSISYPNSKAKHLVETARLIQEEFGGAVPQTVDELITLKGVGRKTAQVVASVAFNVPTFAVDTHIFRIANRIGLVPKNTNTTDKVSKKLKQLLPMDDWGEAHHLLILHGRYTCTARSPQCEACPIQSHCVYFGKLQALPEPQPGLNPQKGAYYCATRRHYFDQPDRMSDRQGVEQIVCPRCGSMNVFYSKSGKTSKQVLDYRV